MGYRVWWLQGWWTAILWEKLHSVASSDAVGVRHVASEVSAMVWSLCDEESVSSFVVPRASLHWSVMH